MAITTLLKGAPRKGAPRRKKARLFGSGTVATAVMPEWLSQLTLSVRYALISGAEIASWNA
jgi:hypothetical protein